MMSLSQEARLAMAAEGSTPSRPSRLFDRYLRCIPLLWFAGLLLPAAVIVLAHLAMHRWPRGRLINVIVFAWVGVGLMQAICALANAVILDDVAEGVHYALSMGVYGWIMGGIAIGVGYSWRLTNERVVRAITLLGGVIIILSAIATSYRAAGWTNLIVPTPVSWAFPNSDTVLNYANATFYVEEDNGGEKDVRMTLFFPGRSH